VLPEERPRHLLGIGDVDDLIRGIELGIDTFDCAMPTRLARHGMALVPDPGRRWRVDLAKGRWRESDEPLMEDCPCPSCAHGFTRGYLRYLAGARETTVMRLLTVHNLAFIERVVRRLRDAIPAGTLAEEARALRAGAAP
jgi:queuine tRNA-ribosyltransferase